MQKLAKSKNKKSFGISMLIFGIVFVLIVKALEYFQMVLFFEGSKINYYTYLIYSNYFLIGFLIAGIGVLLFLKESKTQLVLLLTFIIGMSSFIIYKNIRIDEENYKLIDITLNKEYTDKQLVNYLLMNGFSKKKRKVEFDESGEIRKTDYYPYDFFKIDSENFLTHEVSFEYDMLHNKEKKFIGTIILSIYCDKLNERYFDYSKLKSIFNTYYCKYKSEYQFTPKVSYPSLRTFSFGSFGKGSSLSISKKKELISFYWDSNSSSTHLQFDGATYQPLSNLSNDNIVINVREKDMFITVFQSINY